MTVRTLDRTKKGKLTSWLKLYCDFEDTLPEEDADLDQELNPLRYTINENEESRTIVGLIDTDPEVLTGEKRL